MIVFVRENGKIQGGREQWTSKIIFTHCTDTNNNKFTKGKMGGGRLIYRVLSHPFIPG